MKYRLIVVITLLITTNAFSQTLNNRSEEVDLRRVLQAYAQSSGEKLIVDPRVKGKARAMGISLEKLSFAELTTLLHVHNFSTYRSDGILVVARLNIMKQENVPFIRDGQAYADYEILTDLIFLEKGCEQNFIPLIRPLISPTSFVSTNNNPRAILIVAAYVNILRVRHIVEKIEAGLDKKQNCESSKS